MPVPGFLIFAAVGLMPIYSAVFNWPIYRNSLRVRLFKMIFGDKGARAYFVFHGLAMLTIGIGFATGLIPLQRSR